MQLAMIDEKIVSYDKLEPIYLDRGLYFGDGVYEVIRSYNGKIFAFEEHMQRFQASLNAIGIKNVNVGEIRSRVEKAFEAAGLSNAKIYFHVTRGSGPRNHVCDESLKPNFLLTITELHSSEEKKAKGISVISHPDWRWKRCDIKSLNLLPNVLAQCEASKRGCAEAILVNESGFITEGASSAFFGIIEKQLHTSPLNANILPSITRKFVLKAAANAGVKIIEKSLTLQEVKKADELFIAVTTADIVPVVKFDEAVIADGKPGKITKALADEFLNFIQ